ncbi:amidohydrolase family protein [Streptomyces sp. CA-250714]|uniref:metal-dependent hydrolase family protein n=1 Tax=Streptomyces sp. CA-250714 TaxID=3240060 RepID=UPI003D8EA988
MRLIDGMHSEVVDDAVLETDAAGWITYAGPSARAPEARADVRTVDGRGGTLLPGLFDCHTHLGVPSDRSVLETALVSDPVVEVLRTTARLRATLDAGVTSVRDLGGLPRGFREAVTSGLISGPRVQTSVGVISHTGGHADDTLPSGKSLGIGYCETADDVVGVRTAVRRMLRAGADVIKICTSGGITSAHDDPDDQDLLDEEIAAAVQEGRRHRGRPVAAHAQGRAGIIAAARGAVRSVEHGFGIDDEGCDLIGERGAFLVPTLSAVFQPVEPQKTAPWRYQMKLRWNERAKENLAEAIARKVNIAAGTDAGVTPHGHNLRELSCLVELGMSPMDAIRAATSNSARLLGVQDRLGVLRPGYAADFVLCAGDPLKDIALLAAPERIALVAQQGVIHKLALPDGGASDQRPSAVGRLSTGLLP